MNRILATFLMITSFALALGACSGREVATGAVVGGAGYEYSNKRAMDEINADLKAGRITQEEYDRRKKEIESRSIVY